MSRSFMADAAGSQWDRGGCRETHTAEWPSGDTVRRDGEARRGTGSGAMQTRACGTVSEDRAGREDARLRKEGASEVVVGVFAADASPGHGQERNRRVTWWTGCGRIG